MAHENMSDISIRALLSPALDPLFEPVLLLNKPSAWVGHVPFARWIVEAVRPSTIVELGTHNGVSFAAFCAAVAKLELDTKCYAIDSWQGDAQAGEYSDEVYSQLKGFVDKNYSSFATLIRSFFDEAVDQFEDGSIDLLHIDGFHTYEAVSNDFKTWFKKLSDKAVVLFHDTNERQPTFGVWKFWSEVSSRYPSFEFLHGHGLGVLCVGRNAPEAIRELCTLTDKEKESVRERIKVIGERWYLESLLFRVRSNLGETVHEENGRVAVGSPVEVLRLFGTPAERKNNDQATEPPPDYASWLPKQKLYPYQIETILQRLSADNRSPRFLVAVIDDQNELQLPDHTLSNLNEQLLPGVRQVVLSDLPKPQGLTIDWLVMQEGGWQQPLNDYLQSHKDLDWVQILFAGDELEESTLLLLADRILEHPQWRCCYFDQDCIGPDQDASPLFKPDFNLDMLRSYPYIGRVLAVQRQALLEVGGFDPQFQELAHQDFVFKLAENPGFQAIGHISEVLYHSYSSFGDWLVRPGALSQVKTVVSAHLARLEVPHEIADGFLPVINRIRYGYPEQPLVSILIPTKDQLPMLRRCVETLLEKTTYPNYEMLIIDNDSETPEAQNWLGGIEALESEQVRVLRYPHPFNFSAMNNQAVLKAKGEYLVLLNNDTAVIKGDWLDELLNHARRPEVGIVGSKLLYPDGKIQHAGVILGLNGPAGHPFVYEPGDNIGYMHRLVMDQNYSAVTAACLMMRKAVYLECGGMDEDAFKVSYNDVDLCLKSRQAGYLTVWTPYAVLMHEGNASQDQIDKDQAVQKRKQERFRDEQAEMYRRWLPLLANDPAYNRVLDLQGKGFTVDYALDRGWRPVTETKVPRILAMSADQGGCGHYRIIQPLTAMRDAGLAEGALSLMHLPPAEIERCQFQSVIFQRQVADHQIERLEDYGHCQQLFRVFDLDDNLLNVPLKNIHRHELAQAMAWRLRKALSHADRFVVSTEPLKEVFADFHSDIRVMPNCLPPAWWGDLPVSKRRTGIKPRVGWAGGISHTGDLELIVDVVRDLVDEVHWVFFGYCPGKLQPYVQEVHHGVPIEQYPAKLASLNLDLALAPLEQNVFNECKSHLKLMEYGICGYPVICSDELCYRVDLPVTRVKNRYRDWVNAIREHLADLDACAVMGDRLRDRVQADWMLSGDNLLRWRDAWLPD